MWCEKYRPKTFEEIKGQKYIVDRVKKFVEQENFPHLLFAGPAGVGKSSLALIMAKELFGDNLNQNFLELNASDTRGIDTIRQNVKNFARTKAISNVPFKIIFLDEADSLTKDAQHALRRTMENYSKTSRFILSCNYSSKIIDPIQSRCTVFRFKSLSEPETIAIIDNIVHKEGLMIRESTKKILYEISNGDARKIANILQSCSVINKEITEDLIYEIVSSAKPREIKDILQLSVEGSFVRARDLLLNTMTKHGLSGIEIIKQIQKEVLNLEVEDKKKMDMIEQCGEIEFRMVEGSDEFIQLEALIASFCRK
jgi:replication factor C small subunit